MLSDWYTQTHISSAPLPYYFLNKTFSQFTPETSKTDAGSQLLSHFWNPEIYFGTLPSLSPYFFLSFWKYPPSTISGMIVLIRFHNQKNFSFWLLGNSIFRLTLMMIIMITGNHHNDILPHSTWWDEWMGLNERKMIDDHQRLPSSVLWTDVMFPVRRRVSDWHNYSSLTFQRKEWWTSFFYFCPIIFSTSQRLMVCLLISS